MKNRVLLLLVGLALLIVPAMLITAEADEIALKSSDTEENDVNTSMEKGKYVVLKAPVFSEYFSLAPVAIVNGDPITLGELAASLTDEGNDGDTNTETENQSKYLNILNRLIDSRLIVQEARNIGLDETDEFNAKVKDYKLKLLLKELIDKQLEGLEPEPADVEEIYRKLSREVQLYSLTFTFPADANAFRAEVENEDFMILADKYISEGKAQGELAEQYVKIKELRPQVAQQVYTMEIGDFSITFRTEDGYLLFRLVDSRFVEDPDVKKEAYEIVLNTFRKQKAMEYSQTLEKKYVDFNEDLYEQLDFDTDFKKFKDDERVLATIKGEDPLVITVGDLVSQVDIGFFHGAEKAQSLQMLNKKKDSTIANILFRRTGELEAREQGLDKTEQFLRKVEAFERSTLFSTFMNKVILPEVKLTGEEVKSYYEEHIDDFSSPVMMRMNSIVFENRQSAENAFDKLRKGADFNWVSANATELAPQDSLGVLPLDQNLMSQTSLPEDLQKATLNVKKGDTLLYAPSDGDFFYVLQMENVFPPEAQPFMEVRDEVARIVFKLKTDEQLNEWISKLKEAYETEIFLQDTSG